MKTLTFNNNNKYNPKGFTLAEVLIVLGVMGIISAVTIPNLSNNTSDAEYKAAFKKAYSELNQIGQKMREDNGGTLIGMFKDGDTNDAKNIVSKYFNSIKVCSATDSSCWRQETRNFDGVQATPYIYGAMILKNGTNAVITGSSWVKSTCTNAANTACLGINVDINGAKKPNVYGKDLYLFRFTADKVLPAGINGDVYANACGPGTTGLGCGGWILLGKDY